MKQRKVVMMWYIKHERQCFIGISKHREESWKYDAQLSIFDEIRGVWIADQWNTVSTVSSIWYVFSMEIKTKEWPEK